MQLFLKRELILIAGLMVLWHLSFSQITPAQFPGGRDSLYHYFEKNIHYPSAAREANIEGLVIIKFKINADGLASDFNIKRDIGGGCGNEIEEVLQQMPHWRPAMRLKKPVEQFVRLPFIYRLDNTGEKFSIFYTNYKPVFNDTLVLDTIELKEKMMVILVTEVPGSLAIPTVHKGIH